MRVITADRSVRLSLCLYQAETRVFAPIIGIFLVSSKTDRGLMLALSSLFSTRPAASLYLFQDPSKFSGRNQTKGPTTGIVLNLLSLRTAIPVPPCFSHYLIFYPLPPGLFFTALPFPICAAIHCIYSHQSTRPSNLISGRLRRDFPFPAIPARFIILCA